MFILTNIRAHSTNVMRLSEPSNSESDVTMPHGVFVYVHMCVVWHRELRTDGLVNGGKARQGR